VQQLTCTGPNKVEWCEVEPPEIRDATDALVQPLVVARCDIDPMLIGAGPTRGSTFALGHEAVAEVIAVGSGVETIHIGHLVLPSFWICCGSCIQCAHGKSALCSTYPMLSSYGMEPLTGIEYGGMMSDVVRVPHADSMLALLPAGVDPLAVASVPDNVVDGYRLVAPHLQHRPGAEVVVACHGAGSIGLYAALCGIALGAASVTVASDSDTVLDIARRIGASPLAVDFRERPGRFWPLNLRRLYTLGIELHFGRAHSAELMPEVLELVAEGRLHPELVTTNVVSWSEAAAHYAEPAIKLLVERVA
jgi:threonine dehydrogenase-like Zn-dependent dehydrogenase